jgi:radical SAM protein with 4Fe4S-binding SPASM domain
MQTGMSFSQMKLLDALPQGIKPKLKEAHRALEFYRFNLFSKLERFIEVDVETNSHCNRACSICPRSVSPKEEGIMDIGLYKILISQLSSIGFKGRFSPVFYNEPLLDHRLPQLVDHAHRNLPDAEFIIYTNGSLLSSDKAKQLLDAGACGITVSQYEKNLPKDDAKVALGALPSRYLKKIRYRIMTDDMTLSTRGGLVDVKNPIFKTSCFQSSVTMTIDFKGNVLLCCNDYGAKHIFGNIGEKHVLDIWNSSDFKVLRKSLRSGNFDIDLCKTCSGPQSAPLLVNNKLG